MKKEMDRKERMVARMNQLIQNWFDTDCTQRKNIEKKINKLDFSLAMLKMQEGK